MEVTTKTKIIITVVVIAGSFAAGRFTAPSKIVEETKTQVAETEKKDEKTNEQKHRDKKTVVVEVTKPDGTKERTITQTDITDTTKKSDTTDQAKINIDESTKKEVTFGNSKVSIMGLGVVNITNLSVPAYGVAISKPILGPLTVGVLGLSTGQVGVSVGLTF